MILSFHNFAADIAPHESWGLHLGLMAMCLAALIAVLRMFLPNIAKDWCVRLFGGMAVGALGSYFVSRFVSNGIDPLANIFEILLLVGGGLVAIGLAAQWRRPQPGLNAVLFPMALVVMCMALLLADAFGPSAVDDSKRQTIAHPLLIAHIVLAVVATVQLGFAAIVAGIYLAQDRALSKKMDNSLFRSLPSIETMRTYIDVSIDIGFAALTSSLILGFIVVRKSLSEWLSDPVVDTSLAMWLVFAVVAVGRRVGPLYGKRVVYTVLVGFALVVAFFAWMSISTGGLHSFERSDTSSLERKENLAKSVTSLGSLTFNSSMHANAMRVGDQRASGRRV